MEKPDLTYAGILARIHPVVVTFSRTFHGKSTFAGMTVPDSIGFPTVEDAQRWIDRVTGKSFLTYRYHDATITHR